MQRPEITIAAISSSHTSLYCPAAAQYPLEAHGDRGVCFGFLFLRADGFCSSALSAVVVTKSALSPALTAVNGDEPAAPELLLPSASGCVIQLPLILLPLLV